jgi:hypothetical protein
MIWLVNHGIIKKISFELDHLYIKTKSKETNELSGRLNHLRQLSHFICQH